MSEAASVLDRLATITTNISRIFFYDPQVMFTDTFDRIQSQLRAAEELIQTLTEDEPNYWVVYTIVTNLLPIAERLIFCDYSDQILEFLLSVNYMLSSNLMFCQSRYIPFRLQVFTTVCAAFANTEQSRETDAEQFIQTFKNDLVQLRQLEELNVNGLAESIITCKNEKVLLSDLFRTAMTVIELMLAHFTVFDDVLVDKAGAAKGARRRTVKARKEDPMAAVAAVPPAHTVEVIINSFNSPMPKGEYASKFGHVLHAWTNPECHLGPSLLHRLIYSFLKAGPVDGIDSLSTALPSDPIVGLAAAIVTEKWTEVSDRLVEISVETLAEDFQFFNEIAHKLWVRFSNGTPRDPSFLKGIFHVVVNSPGPCPIQLSIVALQYAWNLDS
jgi:hypothetical protein